MGAFDLAPNIILPDPSDTEAATAFRKKWRWEAHEQVILKGQFTAADQEITSNAGQNYRNGSQNEIEMRFGSARLRMLERMIVDWTFAQNGRKVDVRPETIKRLPANYTTPILEICDQIAVGMSEEEQTRFFESANGHLKENSDPMSLSPVP